MDLYNTCRRGNNVMLIIMTLGVILASLAGADYFKTHEPLVALFAAFGVIGAVAGMVGAFFFAQMGDEEMQRIRRQTQGLG